MKVPRNIEAIIVTLLYLTCLYFWTLPIQDNPLPYGEVDAASHFAVADYTAHSDRSIQELPFYIDKRYNLDNRFRPGVLWYPPPFHTSLAIAAVVGGSSNIPIHLANAILSSLIVLSVYFIVRKFFGFEAALLSGLFLVFSMRDIMIFLWGQWPERMGFAYLPLILYCFYKYTNSYLKKDEKPIYIYIMAIFLAINFFIHPMDFFHSIAALLVISVFFLIKERKLIFNIKHISAAVILFLLLLSIFPLQTMNVASRLQVDEGDPKDKGDFSRLFSWFEPQLDNTGVPQSYFSYKDMIGPYWTIPLILIGLLFLTLRRKRKDLVMLAWIISLYVMIHLDFIGKGRVHRSLSGTAHIFYPLLVLGILYLAVLIPKKYKSLFRVGSLLLVTILMLSTIGIQSSTVLKNSYLGIQRINPYQYEFSQWMKENIDENSELKHYGSISLAKSRWIWMTGHRFLYPSSNTEFNITHIVVDSSDFAIAGDRNSVAQLNQLSNILEANNTLIYSNDFVKVFEIEN